jgi:glutathione synthase/RimK-type ligase-like ATP-grasp enzyme
MDSRTVLINTTPGDAHSILVSYALTAYGHRVFRWFNEDYPSSSELTFRYARGASTSMARFGDARLDLSEVDVVWHRRPVSPQVGPQVCAEDTHFALDESDAVISGFNHFLKDACWINDPVAAARTEAKPIQLRLAQLCGLNVPSTLISNDPVAIRQFLHEHGDSIYKPVTGYVWKQGEESRSTYTAPVTLAVLPRDDMLRAVPGIFQERIEKSFEVRAQFFGSHCAAIAIDSSKLLDGQLDWRYDQDSITRCDPIELPQEIKDACIELMRRLGVVSGGFDFIVDRDQRWFFLEVNQAGQFLFLEKWCSELPVLDAFCQFVERPDMNFRYAMTSPPIRLSDAYQAPEVAQLAQRDNHRHAAAV